MWLNTGLGREFMVGIKRIGDGLHRLAEHLDRSVPRAPIPTDDVRKRGPRELSVSITGNGPDDVPNVQLLVDSAEMELPTVVDIRRDARAIHFVIRMED